MSATAHNEALWEQNAKWWQRTYSGGADPEYDEQILPLVARRLEGARRVLDIGCGEGQVARRIAEVVGVDPAWSCGSCTVPSAAAYTQWAKPSNSFPGYWS